MTTTKEKTASEISITDLLRAGAHFGHKRSRSHPKMGVYVYTTRDSIQILDLNKTLKKLNEALSFVSKVAKRGGIILFVGTKRQAKNIVKEGALSCKMPYVTERWLGGTLTNFETIKKSISKLEELEGKKMSKAWKEYTKKERLLVEREIKKLNQNLEGIRKMDKLPDAVFIVGASSDKTAIREANRKEIPIIALADTDCDPTNIDYLIPANDDAVKIIKMIVKLVAEKIKESKGLPEEKKKIKKEDEK